MRRRRYSHGRARLLAILVFLCPASSALSATPSAGRALAEKYCATCHLFPEPDTLTKSAWMDQIKPGMAAWLGLKKPDYATMPDGEILRRAAIFPSAPLLSEADWNAIWDYYRAAAPPELRSIRREPDHTGDQIRLTPDATASRVPATVASLPSLKQFRAQKLNPAAGAPMISLVHIDSSRHRLLAGDAFAGMLYTFNRTGELLARERRGPASVDINQGTRRSYLTSIGHLFPSEVADGSVSAFVRFAEAPQLRLVLTNLHRPVQTIAADLNQDGREDLVVCTFGNRLGRFSWFENEGDGRYTERVLIERPGAVHAEVLDANGDGRPDIFVMMAQAREGIYLLLNEGRGRFTLTPLIEQPPTWGFASFELADFNRDGKIDLLAVNGDNGDWSLPVKPYHGLRLYLNDGANRFTEKFFYPLPGAYRALARDFDGDGDLDLAAIAFYPDFTAAAPECFVYLENAGAPSSRPAGIPETKPRAERELGTPATIRFVAHTLPEAAAGRWMTMDAGDLDGDGDIDLALGSFVRGPTTQPVPAAVESRWRTNGAAVLLLENTWR